jgi:hypothetical protein
MKTLSPALRTAIILVFVAALLIAYYAIHKPLTPESLTKMSASIGSLFEAGIEPARMATHLLGAALDTATVLALLAVCGGVGRFILRRGWSGIALTETRLGDSALGALIGAGIVSALTLGAALAGWINTVVLWSGLLILGALTWRDVVAWLREMATLWQIAVGRGENGGRTGTRHRVWCPYRLLIAFFLVTSLLVALAPPYSWDSMVYHLVGPQRYLDSGRMLAYSDNFYLGFPKALEMLFVVTMSAFGRDIPPALVHWAFGIFALILTAACVRRVTDMRTALTAALLLLASFNIWELFGWGYVDLAIMAYAAACFALILRWRETRDRRLLILVGALIGFSTCVKLTTAFLIAAIGVFVLVTAPRRVIQNGLLLSIAAVLCAAPWLLRAWALYGNPVFPLLGFGLNWDAARYDAFTREGFGMLTEPSAWQLVFLPLTATVFGYNRGPDTSFTLGPFLLTLGLLLPFVWRWLDEAQRVIARSAVILALPIIILWTYLAATSNTGEQTRLAVALLPLGAVLGGIVLHGVGKMPRKPLDLGFVLRGALLMTTLLAALEVLGATLDRRPLNYLIGGMDEREYLSYNLGIWDGAMTRLAELPDASQVRMMWELRTYHCPAHITCTPDIMFDAWTYPLTQGETPDSVFAGWRAQGDDYLLLYHLGYDFFTTEDTYARTENLLFPPALDAHMTPLWTDQMGTYTLYGWKNE